MAERENSMPGWPGWETVRKLGEGGYGAVYELRKDMFGDAGRCALKHISIPRDENEIREMRIEGQDEESISQSFTDQAKSIVAEYKLMEQLIDCPNVVTCLDVDYRRKDSGYGWDIDIRMELLKPLMELLEERPKQTEEEILRLGRDIAKALAACAKYRIIHRDIKPQNILVTRDGSYKLGDFGIARITGKTSSATTRIGTYGYMAPEVFNGKHYGASVDIYSLGMVLYWLLNERRAPFVKVNTTAEKERALYRRMGGEEIPAPAHGSEELKRIVLKCCAYDPGERYQSAAELLRELENAGEDPEFGVRNTERKDAGRSKETPETGMRTAGGPGSRPKGPDPERDTEGALSPARGETPPAAQEKTTRLLQQESRSDTENTRGVFGEKRRGEKKEQPKQTEDGAKAAEEEEKPAESAAEAGPKRRNVLLIAALAAAAVLALVLLLPKGGPKPTATEEPAAETAAPTENPDAANAAAYDAAEKLAEAGKTYEAARAFYEIKDYRDAWDRCFELWGQITERKTIAAGAFHTLGLRTDGTVVAAGDNDHWNGQCEVGDWQNIMAVSAGEYHSVGLRPDGTVVAVGNNEHGQCDVDGWTDVVAISAGDFQTLGLRADGTVVATEYTGDQTYNYGQGNVEEWKDVIAIFCDGKSHSTALCKDGTVVAVGWNKFNQCEVGDWKDVVAISPGAVYTVGLLSDGTVITAGGEFVDEYYAAVYDWEDIVAIAAGDRHTVGLCADGTVVAVGDIDAGECDVSEWQDIAAIAAGADFTVGLRRDGTVLAVGHNSNGQCDVEQWQDIALPAERRAEKETVPEEELAAAYDAAEKLAEAGETYEAARAFYEIKDYRDAWDRCFELWGQITQRETVSSGSDYALGLRTDGTVVAGGSNKYGQCEVNEWRDIVAISTGEHHAVGLRTDGTVVAAGDNYHNQCNVSDWTDIVAVSVGGAQTMGLRADGTVAAVGWNDYGQCDVSDWTDIVAVFTGYCHTVGLRTDGTVVAAGDNQSGECNVSDWTDIVAISAGYSHTVGLRSDGTVVAVGNNYYDACDVDNWTDIVAVSAGDENTVGLRSDGTVVAAGESKYGVCKVDGWTNIVAVSTGYYQTVGLRTDGTVVAVGYNGSDDVKHWTDIAMPERRVWN